MRKYIPKITSPYSNADEMRMLHAKIDAALYMLRTEPADNPYIAMLDSGNPMWRIIIAMRLAGIPARNIAEKFRYSIDAINHTFKLYDRSRYPQQQSLSADSPRGAQ